MHHPLTISVFDHYLNKALPFLSAVDDQDDDDKEEEDIAHLLMIPQETMS